MSNPVRAQKRRGSISNSGEVTNNDRVGRAGGGSGIGPVLVPPTILHFSKRGYIPIIILLISGIIIVSAFEAVRCATYNNRGEKKQVHEFLWPKWSKVYCSRHLKCALYSQFWATFFHSLSLSAWSDPKVTSLTFTAGMCGKSLTSLYLPTPRFELQTLGAL